MISRYRGRGEGGGIPQLPVSNANPAAHPFLITERESWGGGVCGGDRVPGHIVSGRYCGGPPAAAPPPPSLWTPGFSQ